VARRAARGAAAEQVADIGSATCSAEYNRIQYHNIRWGCIRLYPVVSDCHFAVQRNHFMPGFRSYSVAVFFFESHLRNRMHPAGGAHPAALSCSLAAALGNPFPAAVMADKVTIRVRGATIAVVVAVIARWLPTAVVCLETSEDGADVRPGPRVCSVQRLYDNAQFVRSLNINAFMKHTCTQFSVLFRPD
jgi:hypothetical protein